MKKETFRDLQQWFSNYVKEFYSNDADIQLHVRLKEDHTKRVCARSQNIEQSLGLSAAERLIAETAALLHDVGRFAQYHRYRTFNDMRSLDHAALALDIIREKQILNGLTLVEQDLVTQAIFYHNKRELPENAAGDWVLYAKLVRDADKLDIFEMIVTEAMAASTEVKSSYEYSRGIAEQVLDNQMPRYENIRTAGDQMLFRASWAYGVYFPFTCADMLVNRYVERMLVFLPDDELVRKVGQHLLSYLKQKADESPI